MYSNIPFHILRLFNLKISNWKNFAKIHTYVYIIHASCRKSFENVKKEWYQISFSIGQTSRCAIYISFTHSRFLIPDRSWHLVPTDRAFFSSHSRLRMSPVVPVQTRRGGSGHERLFPLGRLFRSPRRGYGARLAQKLNRRGYVAGTREQAGSLLSFNILASPLAAAARGIDMRSGFRLVPLTFRSATRGTTRHGMTRHDTTWHDRHGTARHSALSHASLRQIGQTFSSGGNLTNALYAAHPISIWGWDGSIRAARALGLFIRPSIPRLSNRNGGRLWFGKCYIPTDSREDLVI